MVNLNNTLFMRSLQARENEMMRKQAMDQGTWDRLLAGQQQLEDSRDRAHARQMQQAEMEGKIAAQLGEEQPSIQGGAAREAASRGFRGAQAGDRMAQMKAARGTQGKLALEALKQQGGLAKAQMTAQTARLGREATNERARLKRLQTGKHHTENLELRREYNNAMINKLEAEQGRRQDDIRGKRNKEIIERMRIWNDQLVQAMKVGDKVTAQQRQQEIDAWAALLTSSKNPGEREAIIDYHTGLSEGPAPSGYEQTLGRASGRPRGPGGSSGKTDEQRRADLAAVRAARAAVGQ